jgi:hypothetical protein
VRDDECSIVPFHCRAGLLIPDFAVAATAPRFVHPNAWAISVIQPLPRSSNVASRIGGRIEGKRRQSEKSRRGMYNNLRWNRFKIGPKAALFLKTPPEI